MKLELHEHISRLLYDHECVIVPGFGAFLTRYYAAEVNHATYMMRPPSRRVYFNSSIRENDGLLAKSISYFEQVNYKQAQDYIAQSTAEWSLALKGGSKLSLSGIGRLYMDESDKLQFSPSLEINYQRSSYGLSIFRTPAVQREAEIRKTITKAIEKHVVVEHPETKEKKVAGWASVAAMLGPVLLATAIGYSYFTTAPQPFENVSGFTPLSFSRSVTESPASEEPTQISVEEPAASITTKEALAEDNIEISPAVEVEPTATQTASAHYHIVVGSFKEQVNANNYIDELRAKGYDAYTAEGNNAFSRVAIGNYSTEEEARKALSDIRHNVNSGSWIFSN
jgi:cell division septation protein DedD/nucleoid DNA-binding protein